MKAIKRYLRRNKLTQRALARKVKMSPVQFSRLLNGQRGTKIDNLARISTATGIPLGKLAKEMKPISRAQP